MSTMFSDSERALDELKVPDCETAKAPKERLGSPKAARNLYTTLEKADEDSSFNRLLVQELMNFRPPHDEKELENKGQSDRFNITTGEGPAIKNEAVSAYVDIYTTPKILAEIPLKPEVDAKMSSIWSSIMAEEYTTMDRSDDASLANHLLLSDTYVTHGIAVPHFSDCETMQYSVAGLDHFKFPRKSTIVTSKLPFATALGGYQSVDLYRKKGVDGWSEKAIDAVLQTQPGRYQQHWNNYELFERDLKSNELYVESICEPIPVIHTWVLEYDGKISYYICSKEGSKTNSSANDSREPEDFLFKKTSYYKSWNECLQIFAFSIGDGGRIYTVHGLGYLLYQLANAMDIMHCKLLDNASVQSSLIVQPATVEDMQDAVIIDGGGFMAFPPTMKIPERQTNVNLNNSLIPAINASRDIINRATGGLAQANLMAQDDKDRQTKLEISSKLDYINKLISFAISLFYGPYDNITREKVRRAFTVPQRDAQARERVDQMKKRCKARGVPEKAFELIDIPRVKAFRIIGTGSRASRIMLFDQMQQMFPSMDAVGRENFVYDYMVELVGVEKANRYVGEPGSTRQPVDVQIAMLENFQLLEGDYMEPDQGEDKMVHLQKHVEELEVGLKDVDEGRLDLVQWTIEHQQLYRHAVATLETTSVHETLQPELNLYKQRLQQIGEIVTNGIKALNKDLREGKLDAPGGEGQEDPEAQAEAAKNAQEMRHKEESHQQDMRNNAAKAALEFQTGMTKLELLKIGGQQKLVLEAQKAMSQMASKGAQDASRKRAESI